MSTAVAKRLRVNFHKPTGAQQIDEGGQAKPCAMGVGWVNPDTLATLEKVGIERTDAKGRPLRSPTKKANQG